MLCSVALVRPDVSEERRTSIIRLTRIGELGTTLAITSSRRTLRRNPHIVFLRSVRRVLVTANVVPSSPILLTQMMEAHLYSELSILKRTTRRHILEDGILQIQFRRCLI
jgi:hypothetical protein